MGYVDLRRREERARGKRGRGSLWQDIKADPYLCVAGGFVLGFLASLVVVGGPHGNDPFLAQLLVLLIVLASMGFWRLRRGGFEGYRPKFGAEKQLLLAMQVAGGRITPVEAALETSLTVDEAEEILTRFAERGHLLVESQDGALSYALPGRRTTGGLDGS